MSCEDILGYDVRLYHPESKHQNLTRHIEMDKTFHKISDEDKGADINHETHVQVCSSKSHSSSYCRKLMHVVSPASLGP